MAGKLTRQPKNQAAAAVEAFIVGAEKGDEVSYDVISSDKVSYDTQSYQWEDPGVRDDVLKVYNLRLPEAYLMKLKYIAKHSPDSMQQFCLGVLLPAIDQKIEELTGSGPP